MDKDDKITLVVQVNGKVRAKISASANLTESDANEIAMEDSGVQKHTEGLEIHPEKALERLQKLSIFCEKGPKRFRKALHCVQKSHRESFSGNPL